MKKKKKVLVVDDNKDTVRIIQEALEGAGFSVTSAYDGKEALDLVRKDLPDLMILDLMMPKMSGYEVCGEIRKDPKTKELIVLMLTARSDVDAKIQGIEGGANDYLVKPVEPREVVSRVRRFLATEGAYQEKVLLERLEAIGQISLTVRHEINNPLAVICGQAQLLLQKKELPEEIRNKTKIIYDMGIRISEIIKQLDQVQDKTREYVRGEKMIDIQPTKKRSTGS
ncbi:MAG TPA: response regulator [Candidatus Manganitrophaceae bacterium]|nr:response regulator [Candidatus Manganitrophaceae bacterium]